MGESPSLRRRLFVWLIAPILVLAMVSAGIAYWFGYRFANQVYDRWIADNTVALSQLVKIDDTRVDLDLPTQAQHMLASDQRDRIYFKVATAAGEFVAGHRALPNPPDHGIDNEPYCYDGAMEGQQLRIAAYRTPDQKIVVQVAETVIKRDTLAREIMAGILLPLIAIIGLAALGVWFGVRRGLAPLDAIAQEIGQRSQDDIRGIDETVAPREIRPIAHALNDLLSRVNQSVAAQRRFVADAAHQLRTPITGLKTQAELALRNDDPKVIRASLLQIVTATDRTSNLVNQLLALARAEPETYTNIEMTSLDLDVLMRATTSDWIPQAFEKGIDLGVESPAAPITVLGNAVLLRELLGNLISNALAYCPRGSVVTVSLTGHKDEVSLSVMDNGPGIPEPERERVFERFHRVLGSLADGSGLGLAIVKQIANSHRAQVKLESGPGGKGTVFTVKFPRHGSMPVDVQVA